MADDHGERLARIEEGIKSLADNFEKHTEEEKRLEAAVAEIQLEVALMRGGYRMFLKLCAALGIIVGLFIAWESS